MAVVTREEEEELRAISEDLSTDPTKTRHVERRFMAKMLLKIIRYIEQQEDEDYIYDEGTY